MVAPKVVIVGGGIGGVNAAQSLAGFADVTVIDRSDQWHSSVMSILDLGHSCLCILDIGVATML